MNRRSNQKAFVGMIVLVLSLTIVAILAFLNWDKIDDKVRSGREDVNERAQEKIENMKEQIEEVQEKLDHSQEKIKKQLSE